jgi:hypothetical protein
MRNELTRAASMTETPIELDKHRGMAAQKATDIRRVLADLTRLSGEET